MGQTARKEFKDHKGFKERKEFKDRRGPLENQVSMALMVRKDPLEQMAYAAATTLERISL